MPGNGRVFICHASEDTARCKPLCLALDAWGVDYFFDAADIPVGEHFPTRITNEISDRDIFIRVATRAAKTSAWMDLETNTFIQFWADERKQWQTSKRTPISLILDDDAEPPMVRANFHSLDTRGKIEREWFAELRRPLDLPALDQASIVDVARYQIRITSPSPQETVQTGSVQIRGSYATLPAHDDVRLFVRSLRSTHIWPQDKVQTDVGSLTWTGRVHLGGAHEHIIFVAVVGKEGRRQVNQYKRIAEDTGKWLAIGEQADDIVECDRVTLVAVSA